MTKLYVIRDTLAGYGISSPKVIDMPTDEYAIRVLRGSVAKGQKPNFLNTNPEDKELWCVGEFDELTGRIKACEPYLIGRAIDFINKEELENDANQSTSDNPGREEVN